MTKATSPSLNTINPSNAVDIVLMKCVVLVAAALKARPALVSDPRILRILLAASRAAGDVEAESRLRSALAAAGGPTVARASATAQPPLVISSEQLERWRQTWPGDAGRRIAMFSAFPGRFLHVGTLVCVLLSDECLLSGPHPRACLRSPVPAVAAPLATDLLDALRATLDAIGAGILPHRSEDAGVLLDNMAHLASEAGVCGTAATMWQVRSYPCDGIRFFAPYLCLHHRSVQGPSQSCLPGESRRP